VINRARTAATTGVRFPSRDDSHRGHRDGARTCYEPV